MQNNVLEVKNLTKKFGSPAGEFTAVDNISFSLKEGEILGLLGPNGAGKTTTIHMLLGVTDPTEGEIRYFGKTFQKNKEEILKKINFASTYINLPRDFTVIQILDIFGRLYEVENRQKRIQKLLIAFDLERLKKRSYNQLSAGEKTRLVLTKAFLNYPKLILLDEPTASLDVEVAVKVREFLLKEKNEYSTSILLTSHNMTEVEEMCDRVIVINRGKIIDQGTPEKLIKSISRCEVELKIIDDFTKAAAFLKDRKVPFHQNKFSFTIPLEEKNVAELLTLLTYSHITYQEISIKKPDLEDYFLQVIQK